MEGESNAILSSRDYSSTIRCVCCGEAIDYDDLDFDGDADDYYGRTVVYMSAVKGKSAQCGGCDEYMHDACKKVDPAYPDEVYCRDCIKEA